jgi:cytochrome P450
MPSWLPTPRNLEFARVKKLLDRVVLELIEARRRSAILVRRVRTTCCRCCSRRRTRRRRGMTDRQLRDEVLTLLTAGHGTVGAALSWAWYLLG